MHIMGDRVMLAAIVISAITSVALGFNFVESGLAWGVSDERCAQVGSMLATHVIETVGTQEYSLGQQRFLDRIASTYGDLAAAEIGTHVRCPLP